MLYIELLILALLILINGVFAMSELAVVSARKARLTHQAHTGNGGARAALRLVEDPSGFLSTVQIGITLVGVLAGAFGGATVADKLGDWLDGFEGLAPHGDTIGIGIVVVTITYLTIVFGELVPKRIALANPERRASQVARPMHVLARAMAPMVWLLKVSTDTMLRVLGLSESRETAITEDEVKSLVAEGTRVGSFVPQEREMIEAVLRLSDRSVRIIMTPRSDIVWIDADATLDDLARTVAGHRISRLLVCEGDIDRPVGTVHTKDALLVSVDGGHDGHTVRPLMTEVLKVPATLPVLKLLDLFRRERIHVAAVVDEGQRTHGIVTLTDVLESIAGEFPVHGEPFEQTIVQYEDGTWYADGGLPLDELEDRLQVPGLHEEAGSDTVAGFVLEQLDHRPSAGDQFVYRNLRFEVVDTDGRRIAKVAIRSAQEE